MGPPDVNNVINYLSNEKKDELISVIPKESKIDPISNRLNAFYDSETNEVIKMTSNNIVENFDYNNKVPPGYTGYTGYTKHPELPPDTRYPELPPVYKVPPGYTGYTRYPEPPPVYILPPGFTGCTSNKEYRTSCVLPPGFTGYYPISNPGTPTGYTGYYTGYTGTDYISHNCFKTFHDNIPGFTGNISDCYASYIRANNIPEGYPLYVPIPGFFDYGNKDYNYKYVPPTGFRGTPGFLIYPTPNKPFIKYYPMRIDPNPVPMRIDPNPVPVRIDPNPVLNPTKNSWPELLNIDITKQDVVNIIQKDRSDINLIHIIPDNSFVTSDFLDKRIRVFYNKISKKITYIPNIG